MNKRAGSFPLFISSKTRYHAEYNISKVLLRWLKGFARFDWSRIASYGKAGDLVACERCFI